MRRHARRGRRLEHIALKAQMAPVRNLFVDPKKQGPVLLRNACDQRIREREIPLARQVESSIDVDAWIAPAEDVLEGREIDHDGKGEQSAGDGKLPSVKRPRTKGQPISCDERQERHEPGDESGNIFGRETAEPGEPQPHPAGDDEASRHREVELLSEGQRNVSLAAESRHEE